MVSTVPVFEPTLPKTGVLVVSSATTVQPL